jgi:hypothetical protein
MKSVISQIFILSAAVLLPFFISCGDALEKARGFEPNKPPLIPSMTAVREDGVPIETHNILPGTRYVITVEACDPEGGDLLWNFTSNCGSFTTPEDTADGCSVIFQVTGEPAGNAEVWVKLVASDSKSASAEKEVVVGYGKDLPEISVSKAALTVASGTEESFTVHSDCTGVFQVYCDNSITSPADAHIDSTKSTCMFGYVSGDADPTVSIYEGSVSLSGYKLKLPGGSGSFRVWVVFKDQIEQEDSALCTVTVP